jgi:hypothetical protein
MKKSDIVKTLELPIEETPNSFWLDVDLFEKTICVLYFKRVPLSKRFIYSLKYSILVRILGFLAVVKMLILLLS